MVGSPPGGSHPLEASLSLVHLKGFFHASMKKKIGDMKENVCIGKLQLIVKTASQAWTIWRAPRRGARNYPKTMRNPYKALRKT